jgi:hypothetical protein
MTDVLELYHRISMDDTFKVQTTLFGHDVDMSVRNIQEIRAMLNPSPILRHNIYYPNRISFCEISFDVTAFGIVHGMRMSIDPYAVFQSLAEAARELTKCLNYNNTQMAMDAAAINFLGVEFYLTDYEMTIDASNLQMNARPTLRALEI